MGWRFQDSPPSGDKCPHCGSNDGITQTVRAEGVRLMGWNGEIWDTDFSKKYQISNPRCASCGKALRSCFKQEDK